MNSLPNCNKLFESENNIYFGSYPSNHDILNLVKELNVNVFINLTHPEEKMWSYESYLRYKPNIIINYPIKDNQCPTSEKSFNEFIEGLARLYQESNIFTIYIHCKGGHGRAGLVSGCLLKYLGYSYEESLNQIRKMHKTRLSNNNISCPQTKEQIEFIKNFNKDL